MDSTNLQDTYHMQKEAINQRILSFQNLPEHNWFYELLFCILTPQSSGRRCWEAIKEIKTKDLNQLSQEHLSEILQKKPASTKPKQDM